PCRCTTNIGVVQPSLWSPCRFTLTTNIGVVQPGDHIGSPLRFLYPKSKDLPRPFFAKRPPMCYNPGSEARCAPRKIASRDILTFLLRAATGDSHLPDFTAGAGQTRREEVW